MCDDAAKKRSTSSIKIIKTDKYKVRTIRYQDLYRSYFDINDLCEYCRYQITLLSPTKSDLTIMSNQTKLHTSSTVWTHH